MKVKSTPAFKLKDKDKKNAIRINLIKTFGYPVEEIVIEKIRGENNMLIVSALVPEDIEVKKK